MVNSNDPGKNIIKCSQDGIVKRENDKFNLSSSIKIDREEICSRHYRGNLISDNVG